MAMTVHEALAERSDVVKRMASVAERARSVARFTEGEEPAEDVNVLLGEYKVLAGRLEYLTRQVNVTNLATVLPSGESVTAAIARRDVLGLQRKTLTSVTDAAAGGGDRYGLFGRSRAAELVSKTVLDVAARRDEADAMARAYRDLDNAIQAANHSTMLVE